MPKEPLLADLSPVARKELGKRIRALVEAAGTQTHAASVARISVQQLGRLMSAKHAPSLLPLARLAEETGYSLDWVATGEGPQLRGGNAERPAEPARPAPAIPIPFLVDLVVTILGVYEQESVKPGRDEVAFVVSQECELVALVHPDEAEYPTILKMAAERTRRGLREPAAGASWIRKRA